MKRMYKSEEAILQKKCNDYLRENGIRFIHFEKGRGKNKTHRKGWPDLIVFIRFGVIFFELKAMTGKISEAQGELHESLRNEGYDLFIVRSFEKFVEIIGGLK